MPTIAFDVAVVPGGPVAAGTPLPWPVAAKADMPLPVVRRWTYGGAGRLSGWVKIKGLPNVPVRRQVRLYDDLTGECLEQTWSDATTGAWEFLGYNPARRYTVQAIDYTKTFRAVVANDLAPVAL